MITFAIQTVSASAAATMVCLVCRQNLSHMKIAM